jgi:hypothetical protein
MLLLVMWQKNAIYQMSILKWVWSNKESAIWGTMVLTKTKFLYFTKLT